jgi:hypothetical protein
VQIAGIQTYIPTPWTFLRYAPLIGEARMPPRMAVLVIMAVAVLFAGALVALGRRHPTRRRAMLWIVGTALAFELTPAPRELHSAAIPSVYEIVARDPRPVRVLELPFGVRDGLSSLGDFSARYQFHQTLHGKRLVGGALSRVSDRKKQFYQNWPFVNALMDLSQPGAAPVQIPPDRRPAGLDFIERASLGYVVMETARVSPQLRRFAIDSLGLTPIAEADGFELFIPDAQPGPSTSGR